MGTLLGDCDRCLADSIAQEVNRLAGTACRFFQLNQSDGRRDALYDESIDTEYKKDSDGDYGVSLYVFFRASDSSGVTGEEGFRVDRITDAEFAIKDFTDNELRRPWNGDIVGIWGKYYDVVISHQSSSELSDSGLGAIMYKVDLVRRTKAPPEGVWLRGKV